MYHARASARLLLCLQKMIDIKGIIYVRIFYLGFLCVSCEVLSGVRVLRCLLRSYKVEQKVITCTLVLVGSVSPIILSEDMIKEC